jgi:hypothetical protein
MASLDGWENFYIIVGSSAAALTGLMFVVVTLTAEIRSASDGGAMNAFATPTVIHFCLVLLIAAIVSVPRHTSDSLRICLGIAGVSGLVYTTIAAIRMRRQKEYAPVFEDWLWHTVLPIAAYTSLSAAVIVGSNFAIMLDVVGASALLLLYIGIHNSWDAAIWMAVHERGKNKPLP